MSYTTTATLESRMYEGIRLLNRSWPAVSQSCNRTVRSSRYMVYCGGEESAPVPCCSAGEQRACLGKEVDSYRRLVHVVEGVIHEACDERCLTHCVGVSTSSLGTGTVGQGAVVAYRSVRRGRRVWWFGQHGRGHGELGDGGAHLNFFSGLLYPPAPDCAMAAVWI